MKILAILAIAFIMQPATAFAQPEEVIRQQFSAKFGFYQPGQGLNNGLLVGVDGITEFLKYNFFISGTIELYPKEAIDMFNYPKPQIAQQQIYVIPIYANIAYKLFSMPDADSRMYAGIGGGYYLYFYNVTYDTSGNSVFGGLNAPQNGSRQGGNGFATIFLRFLLGKVFIEPRAYLAAKSNDGFGSYTYSVNPSGYSITFGFQY